MGVELFYLTDMICSFFLIYRDDQENVDIKDFTKTTLHYL